MLQRASVAVDPVVFEDAFYFVLVPPSPVESRGTVWTFVFLQKPGFWAGSGGSDFNFHYYIDLNYSWVEQHAIVPMM